MLSWRPSRIMAMLILLFALVPGIEPRLLADLPAGVESDFGHDVFPAALQRGELLAGHMLGAPVIDIGTPSALLLAHGSVGGTPGPADAPTR